jgi:hypothetical protein
MKTELQRQFARSHILRRGMREMLAGEGVLTGRGYKRLWNSIIADVYEDMTEAQIKCYLYSFLQCYDITAAERAEVLRLLQLSGTALTEDQRQQILSYLQAE